MFCIYINNGQPSETAAFALAAVSVAIAVLSYRYVEKPFRKPRAPPVQNAWAGLAACTVIFIAAVYVNSADGLPSTRFTPATPPPCAALT